MFLPGKSHGQRSLATTVHGVAKSWHDLAIRQQERFMAGRKGRATAMNPLGCGREKKWEIPWFMQQPKGLRDAHCRPGKWCAGRTSALTGSLSQKPFWQRANILMVTAPWVPSLSHLHLSAFYWMLGWTRPSGIYTHTTEYYSAIKKNEILPQWRWISRALCWVT